MAAVVTGAWPQLIAETHEWPIALMEDQPDAT